ncbi:hypothetical protein POSPLADRAFT_1065467 [Postia placenta MAD-698-R-SB12]|uniref:Deacetylase sirtuin-type domain-containing protein n=1 Tax=Postia placenta MAD-698-R-SB12 TaxID=670580 RepID=A0A1X6N662_9APHY|nr:hypothetical protein POSPLADRAFT_1065467 [Postia placenta MAD-698-R-SB12]OSX64149.1 hypothetical protein POSPLADRAFT_1065467 [Postia placenta MAD-698-R-SB12]
MDPQPPTTSSQTEHASKGGQSSPDVNANAATRRPSSIYALQVQAFLDAAEAVDVDADVVEDLLEGFVGDIHSDSNDDTDVVDVGPAYYGGENEDENASEWEGLLREAQSAWTKEQIKGMKMLLKESGMSAFINKYIVTEAAPIPKLLYAFGICLCPELRQKRPKTLMYFLRVALSRELQLRERLQHLNDIDDAVALIQSRRRILLLTGAGISVSCGIPDFRSRNGLYASLQQSGDYDLDDPQQMFDITYFRENPASEAKIYPSNFIPSPCHRFIKAIEDRGKNYTQNIDTLETLAGVKRVLQCHGSFATASCLNCKVRVPGIAIEDDILNHRVPLCKICSADIEASVTAPSKSLPKKQGKSSGWNSNESDEPDVPLYPPWVMKPDITFFGEKLSDEFDRSLLADRQEIDLLIVIGTSLKVSPVSDIIAHLPHSVPQILINKTPVKHINPDIIMLGNADDIVLHLCRKLGWDLPAYIGNGTSLAVPNPETGVLKKRRSSDFEGPEPQRVGNSHVWLFEGAEGGKWVEELAQKTQVVEEAPEESYSSEADDPSYVSGPKRQRKSKKARTQ